jgi:hypothetical protein
MMRNLGGLLNIFLFLFLSGKLCLAGQRQIDVFKFANKSQDMDMSASERASMVSYIQQEMPDAFREAQDEMTASESNDIPSRQSLCGKLLLYEYSFFHIYIYSF